jgi:hypothetical protein
MNKRIGYIGRYKPEDVNVIIDALKAAKPSLLALVLQTQRPYSDNRVDRNAVSRFIHELSGTLPTRYELEKFTSRAFDVRKRAVHVDTKPTMKPSPAPSVLTKPGPKVRDVIPSNHVSAGILRLFHYLGGKEDSAIASAELIKGTTSHRDVPSQYTLTEITALQMSYAGKLLRYSVGHQWYGENMSRAQIILLMIEAVTWFELWLRDHPASDGIREDTEQLLIASAARHGTLNPVGRELSDWMRYFDELRIRIEHLKRLDE